MKKKLLNKERNEYEFELTEKEVAHRICECLKPLNRNLTETDIYRHKNSKEYRAEFVDEYGFDVNISVGIGNLKRYFGSRIIKLNDATGGMTIRRVIPVPH